MFSVNHLGDFSGWLLLILLQTFIVLIWKDFLLDARDADFTGPCLGLCLYMCLYTCVVYIIFPSLFLHRENVKPFIYLYIAHCLNKNHRPTDLGIFKPLHIIVSQEQERFLLPSLFGAIQSSRILIWTWRLS